MNPRALLGLVLLGALLLPGCWETTYQRVVKAQRGQPTQGLQTWVSETGARCPTPAPPGTPSYEACWRALEQGIGGSGPADSASCAEPIKASDAPALARCGIPPQAPARR